MKTSLEVYFAIRREFANVFPDSEKNTHKYISSNELYIETVALLNYYFESNYKFFKDETLGTYSIFLDGKQLHYSETDDMKDLWSFYTNEKVLRKLELLQE